MGGKVRSIYGLVAAAVAVTAPAGAQSVQYRSAAGVEYRAQRDTGAIARAESALAVDPRNVERIIQLGLAQSGARQFREAIQTFTRGLTIAPTDAMLYRWRGHRYLSVREFDRALDDLTRGSRLDSTNYGIWYHLGIVRYARGDFAAAADAFARAQRRPPDAAELAGATDWLWMALSRAGRAAEAQAMLDRRPDSVAAANAYAQRLRLYRGQVGPEDVITAADTGDVAGCRGGDAELRGGQLVPGARRHGARACLVRALGALRRLARVRIHHVRSRAAAVAAAHETMSDPRSALARGRGPRAPSTSQNS